MKFMTLIVLFDLSTRCQGLVGSHDVIVANHTGLLFSHLFTLV